MTWASLGCFQSSVPCDQFSGDWCELPVKGRPAATLVPYVIRPISRPCLTDTVS